MVFSNNSLSIPIWSPLELILDTKNMYEFSSISHLWLSYPSFYLFPFSMISSTFSEIFFKICRWVAHSSRPGTESLYISTKPDWVAMYWNGSFSRNKGWISLKKHFGSNSRNHLKNWGVVMNLTMSKTYILHLNELRVPVGNFLPYKKRRITHISL